MTARTIYRVNGYTIERIPPWHPYSWALYDGETLLQVFRTLKAAIDAVELRTDKVTPHQRVMDIIERWTS